MEVYEKLNNFFKKKWAYPLMYIILIILNFFIPPITQAPVSPQQIGLVIQQLLSNSITPYVIFAPIFHIATIILIVLIFVYGEKINRILAIYISINYVFIAFGQMIGYTFLFGLVIMIGSLIAYLIIALFWVLEAADPQNKTVFQKLPWWRYWPIPLAVLAFWSPIKNMSINFHPLLLITGEGYGLTFCLTTPIFLCLMSLFYPNVNKHVLRIHSFVGIIYGIYNMSMLFIPYTFWMGFLHIPLMSISVYAFILPWIIKE
ncbi:MAG: hypothetical protein ACTSR3_05630 [Candidatus Helarchaeota archaeon]